jgi:hypothetical protein
MTLTRRAMMTAPLAVPLAGGVETAGIPQVDFGPHKVSRLMVGGNPVSGNSHWSGERSREMLDYFTAAGVLKMLADCEGAGVNTWQSRGDRHIRRLLHEHRLSEGKMHWIAQTASEFASIPRNIRDCRGAGAAGIYHHGSKTDSLWQAGKIDEVREMLKVMRDAGVQTGLGTHIPEVIDYAETAGWDVDFYMTCLYNLSRPREEAARLAGRVVSGDFFWEPDREEMLKRARQTSKQCLIFKVYGAGRRCSTEADMLSAMEEVARSAKANDCVVLGMFPKHSEQVRQNCRLFQQAFSRAVS